MYTFLFSIRLEFIGILIVGWDWAEVQISDSWKVPLCRNRWRNNHSCEQDSCFRMGNL